MFTYIQVFDSHAKMWEEINKFPKGPSNDVLYSIKMRYYQDIDKYLAVVESWRKLDDYVDIKGWMAVGTVIM